MPKFAALTWTVKPGTEDTVAQIFKRSGRPASFDVMDANGNQVGELVASAVFMKENRVVRVMEYEGRLDDVVRHIASQPAVQELEQWLAPYLEVPRETSNAEGFRDFFVSSGMRCIIVRHRDDDRSLNRVTAG
jgi:hypothetical protein